MGKIRNYIFNVFTKASETLEGFTGSKESLNSNIISESDSLPPAPPRPEYIMPNGVPFTSEEKLENNKLLIKSLDFSFLHVVNAINELFPDQDILQEIASTPSVMRIWLAHAIYRNRISKFRSIIAVDTYQKTKQKKIKCLHDLPLQKKLLN